MRFKGLPLSLSRSLPVLQNATSLYCISIRKIYFFFIKSLDCFCHDWVVQGLGDELVGVVWLLSKFIYISLFRALAIPVNTLSIYIYQNSKKQLNILSFRSIGTYPSTKTSQDLVPPSKYSKIHRFKDTNHVLAKYTDCWQAAGSELQRLANDWRLFVEGRSDQLVEPSSFANLNSFRPLVSQLWRQFVIHSKSAISHMKKIPKQGSIFGEYAGRSSYSINSQTLEGQASPFEIQILIPLKNILIRTWLENTHETYELATRSMK